MESQHVSAVLVTEDDADVVGIFTGRDAVAAVLARGRDPVKTPLADVMNLQPCRVVTPFDTAIEALRLDAERACGRHLPIVNDGKGRRAHFARRFRSAAQVIPRRVTQSVWEAIAMGRWRADGGVPNRRHPRARRI